MNATFMIHGAHCYARRGFVVFGAPIVQARRLKFVREEQQWIARASYRQREARRKSILARAPRGIGEQPNIEFVRLPNLSDTETYLTGRAIWEARQEARQ